MAGDRKEQSELLVVEVPPLFHMNYLTDNGRVGYFFLHCMKYTTALNEVDKELDCVCLRWCTSD